MRHPAFVPAIALVAGATVACLIPVHAPSLACVSALAWLAALLAFYRQRQLACTVAATSALVLAEWSLAAGPFRRAENPPACEALASRLPTTTPLVVGGRLQADAVAVSSGISLELGSATATELDGRPVPVPPAGIRLLVGGSMAAARAGEWRAGRAVRIPASLRLPPRLLDPGVQDARLQQARRGTVLVGGVKSAALVQIVERGGWWPELAAALRGFAREAIATHVGRWHPRSAAIVTAILIGDRAGLDDDVRRRLQEAGTYHVIAISGGNIAVLAAVLLGLLWALRVPMRIACWAAASGLAGYSAIVGGGPSVVRATLMAVAILAARQADYRSPPLNALAVACGLILAFTPLSVVDAGFALTFGATLGILAAARTPLAQPRGPRWTRPALSLLAASVAAELALFPVSAYTFSRVTFAGLLLNFVAIPLMSLAQVAGLLVLLLAATSSSAATWAGWVAHIGAHGLVESAGLVTVLPWLSWRLPPPHIAVVGCYYAAWCLHSWTRAETGRLSPRAVRRLRLGASMAIAATALWILVEPVSLLFPGVSGRLRVTVLDVGHADAVLVQLPDRRSLLVDAGGSMTGTGGSDIGGRVVVPAAWALGTRRLDALVISHGDPDHVGGAEAVVRDLRPREIWEGVPVPAAPALSRLLERAAQAGVALRRLQAGEHLTLGEVVADVHHPPEPDWERRKVRNDDSVVLELRYRGVSIVLPGDVGVAVERAISHRLAPARFRVLKVPHHGSASSSSTDLLAAARPDVAVISASATTRVPPAVLHRYAAAGAAVLRTSDDGAVTITTDGRTVTVETWAGRRMRFSLGG